MKRFSFAVFVMLLSSIVTSHNISYAQSSTPFGKNKVQYKEFKWKYIQSEHFDIYFSQGGEGLAEFSAFASEKALDDLQRNLDYKIQNRIPIIIYNSHNEFQQNNVIDEFLEEGVGGVTELFKNRVNVPFEGDYEQFRHVLHHELLHAFMNDMYYGGSIQNIISRNITLNFPLWFNEGMAEVQSLYGLDKETDMFMRDAVINNYLPPIDYIGGYFAYRGGQSFFAFLADYYGEEKLGELMNNIKALGDVDAGFRETFNLDIEKISEKWQDELKKTYWPEIAKRENVKDFAKRLTDHNNDGGFYNVAPVISPQGDKFAFISNRDDFFDVFIARTSNGQVIKKVIEGNNSSNFEELKILTPGLAWSPSGRKLAISVKAGESDAIFIVDVESGDKQQLPLKFDAISNVDWSPVSDELVFIGARTEKSDVYTYNLNTRKLIRITNDVFSDFNPTYSPDGRYVYFRSDRGDYLKSSDIPADFKMYNYDYDRSDIYRVNLNTKEMTRVTNSKGNEEDYIQFSSDGSKVIYVSDKNGIKNIYLQETDSAGKITERPLTNSLNPIDQISLSRDGKKLVFVSLNNGGYDVFSLDNPLERNVNLKELEPTAFVTKEAEMHRKFGKIDSIDTGSESLAKSTDSTGALQDTLLVNNISSPRDSSISSDTSRTGTDTSVADNQDSVKIEEYTIDFKRDSSFVAVPKDTVVNKKFVLLDNYNSDGSFKVNDYKVKFSPDIVYGNADYSSFYGVQGVAQIALSDMLGNHRIYILTSMVIDLKNSDYALAYYYLPKRIDYGFEIFHTARFILYDYGYPRGENLYRYRQYGATLNASYPITRFKRFDGGVSFVQISRENLDVVSEPFEKKSLIVPTLSFVHDNTFFGYTAPIKGTRYNLTAFGSPKLGTNGLGFGSLVGDFRTYFKLGDDYSFALRMSGGASFGPNPQRFYLGGTENWINRTFENNNIPVNNIEDFAFSTPGIPLRGYNYDRISGSKYSLMNLELRFPLLRYLIFGALPLGLQNVQGVAFVDAGTAWSDSKSLQLFERTESGRIKTRDLLMGMGFGARVNFFLPLKFDVAWSYDLNKFSKPKFYFSLGYDF